MNNDFIEIIKDIAAVLGCVVTLSGVLSIFSKSIRSFLSKIFLAYGDSKELNELREYVDTLNKNSTLERKEELQKFNQSMEELTESIQKLEANQNKWVDMYEEKLTTVEKLMDIDTEFVRTQCRNIVKNMFYKYCEEEKLPLYEFKTLIKIEELYVGKCKGNSFAQELITRMKTWEIDYANSLELEEE